MVASRIRIDLNCDVGEGFGAYDIGCDADLIPLATSANVACGFHAGDPSVIERTVALAVRAGVVLGAHPGHWDLRGFGRRNVTADPAEVEADVVYQTGAVLAFARAHGSKLVHVKPHGALYNQAAADPKLARAIARAVRRIDKHLVLVGLAGSQPMRKAAEAEGLRFAAEAFADRAYERDGTLRSRRLPDSILTRPEQAAAQAVSIVRDGVVRCVDGGEIAVHADTICVHGDNPSAVANARAVRQALEAAGVEVKALEH